MQTITIINGPMSWNKKICNQLVKFPENPDRGGACHLLYRVKVNNQT